MATPKKNTKSSKTAHVLNLLAPGGENETIRPPAVSQAEPPVSPENTEVIAPAEGGLESSPRPLAPPILEVARNNDEQISLQIKDALENELLSELDGALEAESEPEPEPEPEPKSAPKPAGPDPDELVVVNVMESLVAEKAPRYIKMFGLCSCERCAADVRALTLTNLQPSYIVRRRTEAHAMLTVYESRYNSTIFAQLTRACKIVVDSPRHDRENLLM